MSQGFQPAAGTSFGAKDYVRVKKMMGVFVGGAVILSLVFYLPVMFAPKFMLNLLIPDDPALVEMGTGSTGGIPCSYDNGYFGIIFSNGNGNCDIPKIQK